ncbi:MAG TPA: hypothetical protein VMG12_00730, partial [Polyangiaceae bacterium]|nr:hypothetical protein [Polyangiaceae bacterium]
WLRLLACQLLACFGLMFGAGSAWAAAMPSDVLPNGGAPSGNAPNGNAPNGNDEPAPMCDPDGASVAAGVEIPEVDRGRFDALPFDALPCEAQLLLAGWRLDDPALGCKASFNEHESPSPGPQQLPRPRCEGIRELSIPFPERVGPALVLSDDGERLTPSRGHSRGLFRPPAAQS